MKKIKIGTTLMIIGFFLYLVNNLYFGWNAKPMSVAEENFDAVVKVFFYIGFMIYINPLFKLYEKAVKKSEEKGEE